METLTYLSILLTIAVVSALAWGNALLSFLIDYCFWDGSIAGSWLPWLASKVISERDWLECQTLPDKKAREAEYINRAQGQFVYMILGGCIFCSNVWLSFATFAILNISLNFGWAYLILFTSTSHFFLRRLRKV